MANGMVVTTNNVPRDLLDWHELTDEEKSELDYVEWGNDEPEYITARFFRYRGNIYDVNEFLAVLLEPQMKELLGWDGYQSDSYFSGIVMRYVDENFESVVVGTYVVA